jgi:hypothetical protein
VHFLRTMQKWIGLERGASRIGLRPHREIEVNLNYDGAFDRCRAGIEEVLGAIVRSEDRESGIIEAGFGTVNQERIVCTLERVDAERTRIRIEARFPATVVAPARSPAVDTLADYLLS